MGFKSDKQRKYLEAVAQGKQLQTFHQTPVSPKQVTLNHPLVADKPVSTNIDPVKSSIPQAPKPPKPPKAPSFGMSPAGASRFGKVKKMFGGF